MQEDENKTLQSTENEEKNQIDPEDDVNSVKGSRDFTRRTLLHVVCSGYLIYLSVKLITSFIQNYPAKGWNGDTIVCLAGSVVFTGVAIVLLVGCVKRLVKRAQESRQNDTTERKEDHD
jgi:hypothetical protein